MQDKELEFYKIVGKILREERLKKDLKFTIFCYENDFATSSLNSIENAKAQIYFSNIAKVVKALGLSFEEFGALLDKELPEGFLEEN